MPEFTTDELILIHAALDSLNETSKEVTEDFSRETPRRTAGLPVNRSERSRQLCIRLIWKYAAAQTKGYAKSFIKAASGRKGRFNMESRICDLIYVLAFAAAFQFYIAIAGAIVIYGPRLVKRIGRQIKRSRQRAAAHQEQAYALYEKSNAH